MFHGTRNLMHGLFGTLLSSHEQQLLSVYIAHNVPYRESRENCTPFRIIISYDGDSLQSTRWAKRNGNTAQPQEIEMSERLWGTGMRHCCSNTLSQAVGLTGNVIVMWQIPIIIQKSESVCFSHICSSSVDE